MDFLWVSINGKEGTYVGVGRRKWEKTDGNEGLTDYKFAKNGGCEAIATIFILLFSGNLFKWV